MSQVDRTCGERPAPGRGLHRRKQQASGTRAAARKRDAPVPGGRARGRRRRGGGQRRGGLARRRRSSATKGGRGCRGGTNGRCARRGRSLHRGRWLAPLVRRDLDGFDLGPRCRLRHDSGADPPGKPAQRRDGHLPQVKAPMLFVQGARDVFGTRDEIAPLVTALAKTGARTTTRLFVVEGGDHSHAVPKRAGVPQGEVDEAIADAVVAWMRELTQGSRRHFRGRPRRRAGG